VVPLFLRFHFWRLNRMQEWKFKEKENGGIKRVHHTEEFFDSVSSIEAVIREQYRTQWMQGLTPLRK